MLYEMGSGEVEILTVFMMSDGGGFVQFRYCEICRVNHDSGPKHVFTKKHKQYLEHSLSKLAKKVSAARKELNQPIIQSGDWEDGVKFWCYFCKAEVEKHTHTDGGETMKNGGLIKHMASEDHSKNMDKFWKCHRLDNGRKSKFIFMQKQVENFQKEAGKAVEVFRREKHVKHVQVVQKIRQQEVVRERIQEHSGLLHHMRPHVALSQLPLVSERGNPENSSRIRTVGAVGAGLTCVKVPRFDPTIGNVHMGSTPPWLQKNSGSSAENEAKKMIGPTMQDYERHLEAERKRKLPACRVGASTMGEESVTDRDWLPSFGRVWSSSRRSHARNQFMKHNRRKDLPATMSTVEQESEHAGTSSNWAEADLNVERDKFEPDETSLGRTWGLTNIQPYVKRKQKSAQDQVGHSGHIRQTEFSAPNFSTYFQPIRTVHSGYANSHQPIGRGSNTILSNGSRAGQNWTIPATEISTAKKQPSGGSFSTNRLLAHQRGDTNRNSYDPNDPVKYNSRVRQKQTLNLERHQRTSSDSTGSFTPIQISDNLL